MACGIKNIQQFTNHKSKICASGIYVPGKINRVNILHLRIHTQNMVINYGKSLLKLTRRNSVIAKERQKLENQRFFSPIINTAL